MLDIYQVGGVAVLLTAAELAVRFAADMAAGASWSNLEGAGGAAGYVVHLSLQDQVPKSLASVMEKLISDQSTGGAEFEVNGPFKVVYVLSKMPILT